MNKCQDFILDPIFRGSNIEEELWTLKQCAHCTMFNICRNEKADVEWRTIVERKLQHAESE